MSNNASKLLFLLILMMGTMITISSNSWLGAWMGLEINLLSFIPLMSDNTLMSTESSLKYFLTQALASSILLFAIILIMQKQNFNLNFNTNMLNSIILSSLMLKSGAAPLHFWFPNVMEGLSWINSLILMTWQKIAPLMLISYVAMTYIINVSIISSVIIGALMGFNQTSLRKLMAFSSINHLGWMLSAMYSNESLWLIYFCFYSFLSIVLIYLFMIFKIQHINQLFMLFTNSKILKFFLLMNLLSLGGLPPFIGFIPKWLTIQMLVNNNQFFLMTIMVMTALITLFMYLRLCYTSFMLNNTEMNWMKNMYYKSFSMYIYLTLSFISIFGLFLISTIYFML